MRIKLTDYGFEWDHEFIGIFNRPGTRDSTLSHISSLNYDVALEPVNQCKLFLTTFLVHNENYMCTPVNK